MPAGDRLTVGVGFENVTGSADELRTLAGRLDEVGASGVTIGIGRPDWVAFPWDAHPDTWAIKGRLDDRVRVAMDELGTSGSGRQREVTLVIDVLAPRLIEDHPEEAGVSADGERSDLFPGAASYRDGVIGKRIVELCAATAERYRPDRIALTELILDQSFSDADLAAYRDLTGNRDWPRDNDGDLDTDDPSLATFRSEIAADLAGRCDAAAAPHGVQTDVDVRAAWDDPTGNRAESGHDYELLLTRVDRLTIWNYYALNGRDPAWSEELTAGLRDSLGRQGVRRITVSVGLWADGDGDVAAYEDEERTMILTPNAMAEGVRASLTNGVTSVSVTPASRMTDQHWAALKALGFEY